jgi:hypothetical protein
VEIESWSEHSVSGNTWRKSRDRAERQRKCDEALNDVVSTPAQPFLRPTAAQSLARREILRKLAVAPTPDVVQQPRATFEALLKCDLSYAAEEVQCTVEPYDENRASLPHPGAKPVRVELAIDSLGWDIVVNYKETLLLDEKSYGLLCETGSKVTPCMDVRLKADDELY